MGHILMVGIPALLSSGHIARRLLPKPFLIFLVSFVSLWVMVNKFAFREILGMVIYYFVVNTQIILTWRD